MSAQFCPLVFQMQVVRTVQTAKMCQEKQFQIKPYYCAI